MTLLHLMAPVAVALAAILSACGSAPLVRDAVSHPAISDPVVVDSEYPPEMVEITFESGGSRMNGLVYVASGPGPHPTMILLHGYPGNERNLDLAQALRRSGTNVVFFNYRGTWGSGGEFSIPNALDDVTAVVERVRDPDWASAVRGDPTRVALVGHSLGGFLGALVTTGDERLPCVASIAGVNMGVLGDLVQDGPAFRSAIASAMGADMDPGGPVDGDIEALMDDLARRASDYDLIVHAENLASRPLLLVAGTRDVSVAKEVHHDLLVEALLEAGAEAVTEIVYNDGHAFSSHRVDLARQLVDWQRAACWP